MRGSETLGCTPQMSMQLPCFAASASPQQLVVIELVVVLGDLAPDFGGVHPRHKVLHGPCHKEGWVRHCLCMATHFSTCAVLVGRPPYSRVMQIR